MIRLLFLLTSLIIAQLGFAQQRHILIDSTKIWVNTIGLENRVEGQPVIVFENGLGVPMDNWDKVLPGVSALAPLVTYDRAGVGKSEPVEDIPDIETVSTRLVKMLNKLDIAPPYVLVGHSMGGLYVRGFAIHYPELLAGLVIVDPADFTETHSNQRGYYDFLDWEEARVDSLIDSFVERRKESQKNAAPAIRREGQYLEAIRAREFKEIMEHPLPNIPVHIIVGGKFDMPAKYHSPAYDELKLFRSKMALRNERYISVIQTVENGMFLYSAKAGHYVQWEDPQMVVSSIRMVLADYASSQQKE